MNHPSEWAKFFDERTGRHRYKHKGSGLVRDSLMAIGKSLKKVPQMWQKRLYEAPLRRLEKNSPKWWLKKGLIKYNEFSKGDGPKHQPRNYKLPVQHRKSHRAMQ